MKYWFYVKNAMKFLFLIQSHDVAQLALNLRFSCLFLLSAGVTGVSPDLLVLCELNETVHTSWLEHNKGSKKYIISYKYLAISPKKLFGNKRHFYHCLQPPPPTYIVTVMTWGWCQLISVCTVCGSECEHVPCTSVKDEGPHLGVSSQVSPFSVLLNDRTQPVRFGGKCSLPTEPPHWPKSNLY